MSAAVNGIGLALIGLAGFLYSKNAAGSSTMDSSGSGTGDDGGTLSNSTDPVFTRFDFLFSKYGNESGVDPKWLKAICMNESDLGENPLVKSGRVSSDGKSKGIMQLTEPTANDFEPCSLDDLNDPDRSVRIAAKFVAWLQGRFETVDLRYTEWVIKSYNQGVGNTQKERAGKIGGYADEYWARWQRNYSKLG